MYGPLTYTATKEFIKKYGIGVANSIKGTGLYFPAVIAQSALESGYGKSIPEGSNNFGGIKYNPNIHSGYIVADTTEFVNGKKVKIVNESGSLGDGIAWLSYVDLFQKKHKCILDYYTPNKELFQSEYPNINFFRLYFLFSYS
jgi:hypothetical protein